MFKASISPLVMMLVAAASPAAAMPGQIQQPDEVLEAQKTPEADRVDAPDMTADVISQCALEGWQINVKADTNGTIYPEESPTITPDQQSCIDTWIGYTGHKAVMPGNGAAEQPVNK